MVILTVLIFARGIMPRELARRQSRSSPLCLSAVRTEMDKWEKTVLLAYPSSNDSLEITYIRQSSTFVEIHLRNYA